MTETGNGPQPETVQLPPQPEKRRHERLADRRQDKLQGREKVRGWFRNAKDTIVSGVKSGYESVAQTAKDIKDSRVVQGAIEIAKDPFDAARRADIAIAKAYDDATSWAADKLDAIPGNIADKAGAEAKALQAQIDELKNDFIAASARSADTSIGMAEDVAEGRKPLDISVLQTHVDIMAKRNKDAEKLEEKKKKLEAKQAQYAEKQQSAGRFSKWLRNRGA